MRRDWEAVQLNWKSRNKPDDVGRSLGGDGGGPTTRESGGDEIVRQEKGKSTIKMGRLH